MTAVVHPMAPPPPEIPSPDDSAQSKSSDLVNAAALSHVTGGTLEHSVSVSVYYVDSSEST